MLIGALLLQSIHAFHHLEQFVTAQHCNHKYAQNKTEINHAHNGLEHCFVCEFAFSSSLQTENIIFSFQQNALFHKASFLNLPKNISFFSGSSLSLRGPPII